MSNEDFKFPLWVLLIVTVAMAILTPIIIIHLPPLLFVALTIYALGVYVAIREVLLLISKLYRRTTLDYDGEEMVIQFPSHHVVKVTLLPQGVRIATQEIEDESKPSASA